MCFFTSSFQAAQQDVVMKESFLSILSINSFASNLVVISAPWATSTTSLKPHFNKPVLICPGVSLNWPTTAGANIATTFLPSFILDKMSTIWLFSWIAPNGHLARHFAQDIHFSSKLIFAWPDSSFLIASTGQAFSQGTTILVIALYGHAWMHMPQFLHFVGSIFDLPFSTVIAPNLQEPWHGLATQPWQRSVTCTLEGTQPLQASWRTVKVSLSGSFLWVAFLAYSDKRVISSSFSIEKPSPAIILSLITARSLWIQHLYGTSQFLGRIT